MGAELMSKTSFTIVSYLNSDFHIAGVVTCCFSSFADS